MDGWMGRPAAESRLSIKQKLLGITQCSAGWPTTLINRVEGM